MQYQPISFISTSSPTLFLDFVTFISKLTSAARGSDPILVAQRNVECPGDVPQVGSTNANLKRGIQGISWDLLVDLIQANDIFIVRFHGTSENTVVLLTPAEGGSLPNRSRYSGTLPNCVPQTFPNNVIKQEGFSPGW